MQLVFASDQELNQTDWLPISRKQISHPKDVLCPHVQLPMGAFRLSFVSKFSHCMHIGCLTSLLPAAHMSTIFT